MADILSRFRLHHEKENYALVTEQISAGVIFKGTNLWVLIFAIFIASLGLNVNSTAVIIGAMLVSPLMGPIMGMGLGVATNDISLLRTALSNFLFATIVSLITSTLYFLITPLSEAHSELLARTSPNVYDVLIALFGGLAGMLATSSRLKGNVIPGVAIATALMPPLCTAGYGIATAQWPYFFGAIYLFTINTVFIGWATIIIARFLHFPSHNYEDKSKGIRTRMIITSIVLLTLIPSIYFAYEFIEQNRFKNKAGLFIEKETQFPNNYLFRKEIDSKNKKIKLTFGGEYIDSSRINQLTDKLDIYGLQGSELIIHQGFAYLAAKAEEDQKKEGRISDSNIKADSSRMADLLTSRLYKELKSFQPGVQAFMLNHGQLVSDSLESRNFIAYVRTDKALDSLEKEKIRAWLQTRIVEENIILVTNP